jgi:hypothetical protein
MSTEQILNFCAVFTVGVYAGLRERSSVVASLKQIGLGFGLIALQLILNELAGGDLAGVPVTTSDVLLLRAISYNHLFALLGYGCIFAAVVSLVRTVLRSGNND